jgi:hydroxymethylglutaryl-CoA lyase
MLSLIECPRDAMQGFSRLIPTAEKVSYLNALLKVGFHTLDFGSFVSPKAIPQMQDTAAVLEQLELNPKTKMLAIIANLRGAEDALQHAAIDQLGFPFSLSETFQQRNTGKTRQQAFDEVLRIHDACVQKGKELVVYLSMGFGNPYGDFYHPDLVYTYASQFQEAGIGIISLADTTGVAQPNLIKELFSEMLNLFPNLVVGAHLHASSIDWERKIAAAYESGCSRFDSAMGGFGGCPMAQDELVGNIPTEPLIAFFKAAGEHLYINDAALLYAQMEAQKVFQHT